MTFMFCKKVPYHKNWRLCFSRHLRGEIMLVNARVNKAVLSYIFPSLLYLLLFISFTFFPLPPSSPQCSYFFPPFSHPFLSPNSPSLSCLPYPITGQYYCIWSLPSLCWLLHISVIYSFSLFLPLSITICPLYLLIIPPPFFSFHCQISCY